LIVDLLLMSRPAISLASLNATSSRASRGGLTHCDSPDGRAIERSGPHQRLASLSRTQASNSPRQMIGIYGPTSFDCSVPEGPLSSLENRLRQRLGCIGSTEYSLTWKASTTPGGRSYSRLAPSTPRTVEIVSISSDVTNPPPIGRDGRLDHRDHSRLEGHAGDGAYPTGWTFEGRSVAATGDGRSVGDVDGFGELERGLPPERDEGSDATPPARQVHAHDADRSDVESDSDGFGTQVPTGGQLATEQVAGCDLDTDRPWSSTTYIIGHDGKARRIEPTIRLLADGFPSRNSQLRALGNAIVPYLAAQVIRSYLETNP